VAAVHRGRTIADAHAGVVSAVAAIGEEARRFAGQRRIASRGLTLWPAHDQQGRQHGFEARHRVEIGCPDLSSAAALVDALVAAVGDRLQVDGVSLQVADPSAVQASAREAAYADAQARAAHLAGLAGMQLGQLVSVTEGAGLARPAGEAMRAMAAETAFEPGEHTVDATLTATWQLAL
jgi:uncharacterized protein YggE